MSYITKRRLRTKAKSIDIDTVSNHHLPALRRKRTLAINRLSKTLEVANLAKIDETQLDKFISYYSEVKRNVVNFEEAHASILSVVDASSDEAEDRIRCNFDDIYFEIVTIHRKLTHTESHQSNDVSISQSHNGGNKVKLPKINIPKFSGNIKTWPEFYDIFHSLIHENESLSDTERMHYLVSSLSGDALALVRIFPATGKYYTEAYEALVARYKNKRELAFTCWKEMQNIILKSNNAHEFRRVLDTFNENLSILKRLDLPVASWDFVLCYLLLSKMDSTTRREFEQEHTTTELPSYLALTEFLYSKCEALVRDTHFTNIDRADRSRPCQSQPSKGINNNYLNKIPNTSSFLTKINTESNAHANSPATSSFTQSYRCSFCGENHSINNCQTFTLKSIQDRMNYAKTHNWCYNCLKSSHGLRQCKSIFRCQKCNQRHHTLLHLDEPKAPTPNAESSGIMSQLQNVPESAEGAQVALTNIGERSTVLLSTAQIQVRSSNGQFQTLRALIDSGSQAHFVTEHAANVLGIERVSSSKRISGLGQALASVSGVVSLEVGVHGKSLFKLKALTLPNICGKMPTVKLSTASWSHIQHLQLADPECHMPGPIDILLGAEIFPTLLLAGSIHGDHNTPSALNSVFGWLLMGNVEHVDRRQLETNAFFVCDEPLDNDHCLNEEIKRFWELENIPTSAKLTPEEELCESKYINEHSRDITGRYIVTLPFKSARPSFPGSREVALQRLRHLERKLAKNIKLRKQYNDFMRDYNDSGHMTKVAVGDVGKGKYYIPHHCIVRPDSATTKLRVVFDASAKDASGQSLNDSLLIGQKLQTNIVEILLRFRVHLIVFTADVKQMYRQMLCEKDDRTYQRILWRYDEREPIHEYELNTVTYGVSAAPYLALRTIKQVVKDHGDDYPFASAILNRDVYVDDIVSGASTFEQAQQAKSETTDLMKKGCFELRKWASNVPELLTDLSAGERLINVESISLDIETSHTLKILGLKWNPQTDQFTFDVKPLTSTCTKRTILSELARIFDPLGFVTPVTFIAKCYVQKLWVLGIEWDAAPPLEIVAQWDQYRQQLPLLMQVEIPRRLSNKTIKSCQLHGFADSSETGYGAVVYLRTIDNEGDVSVSLVCSKSRVAPVKKVSLPRLELCTAVLLADLLKFVFDTYSQMLPVESSYAWSDSTVVLAWLASPSNRWKTFVANRVSHVHDVLPSTVWNHVPTEENPADIASRGLLPAELLHCRLWWAGPNWLAQSPKSWPVTKQENLSETATSEERLLTLLVTRDPHILDNLVEKFSSIRKAQRVLAYCLRFITNIKRRSKPAPKTNRTTLVSFNQRELHDALLIFVRRCQAVHFNEDIRHLDRGTTLAKQMRKLNPFLDQRGVMRVGGRLSHSGLEFEHNFPALLPRNSTLTYRIIEAIHRENCHAGLNTVQYLITQQFWILSPKRAIRHCLSNCMQCYRTRPVPIEPFMGDLPATRVNQAKAFSIVGVDYAGPFRIKTGNLRGANVAKAYLCLFVCFTTKAVHLELASDMSTDAYLAALRRFVSRRGRISVIHSDNGTNFLGACNEINRYMQHAAEVEQIEFRFNPPSSPHFGGVWEIQIKAVKSHLYRIIGDQTLTFEELNTVFVQIEAMLNSRPICPLSSDPNDVSVLTPGHFLTLEPLTAVPDTDLTDLKINRLGRWQLIQRLQQDFWKRWKIEYLHQLTKRTKWSKHCESITPNSIVIMKSENTMPIHWPLARVIDVHPGPDGVTRVATIKTANGSVMKRAVTKLCPLPMSSNC